MSHVLNLNKPLNISSHGAVSSVKKKLSVKKAGHAGTLDPLAEGVLLVCIDEATKISRFLAGMEKEYEASITLGQATDTFDSEGKVTGTSSIADVREEDVRRVIEKFTGIIWQVPPMYSAVKVNGQKLYKLARKGSTVEREGRKVNIKEIEMTSYEPPIVSIRVICSKGTYIRTLADDIGKELGVGAYLSGLTRTRVGNFSIEDAVGLDEDMQKGLVSMDSALSYMPEIRMRSEAAVKLQNGVRVEYSINNVSNFRTVDEMHKMAIYRLKNDDGRLFAIARIEEGVIRTERVFSTKPKEVF